MSWFTDRSAATAAGPARPWLPRALPAAAGLCHDCGPPPAPGLTFTECDLAQVAAATSVRATHDAKAACAADPATRLAQALERMAEALAAAGRRHAGDDTAAVRRTVQLAAAIARAADPVAGDAQGLVDRVCTLLAGLNGPPAATLVVTASVAEELRRLLPEIAARAGFVGGLEIEPDPRLPDGAVQLLWPGGWLEHDPADIAARVAELLAAHDPQPLPTAADGTDHEHEPA